MNKMNRENNAEISAIEVYTKPGSSRENETGNWRQELTPLVTENCTGCGLCITTCPEGVIYTTLSTQKLMASRLGKLQDAFPGGKDSLLAQETGKPSKKEKQRPEIDYDYCKGCGICEEECSPNAIEMVLEGESIEVEGVENEGRGIGEQLAPGHSSCAGCGNAMGARYVLEGINYSDKKPIVVAPTGCTEIFTTIWPHSSWEIPFIHSLFENAGAVASGIALGIELDKKLDKKLGRQRNLEKVIVFAGDGGTADIGLQSLSGMIERGDDVLYIMLDNEAYMNTGIQRSSSTPLGASTTTSVGGTEVLGKQETKKPMVEIVAAHGGVWAAATSIANPADVMAKSYYLYDHVKGPAFLQIHAPCPRGWRFPSSQTRKVGKSAIDTGLWVPYVVNDKGETYITQKVNPEKLKDVRDYLRMQGRFKHLFTNKGGDRIIEEIQRQAREGLEMLIQRSLTQNQRFC